MDTGGKMVGRYVRVHASCALHNAAAFSTQHAADAWPFGTHRTDCP